MKPSELTALLKKLYPTYEFKTRPGGKHPEFTVNGGESWSLYVNEHSHEIATGTVDRILKEAEKQMQRVTHKTRSKTSLDPEDWVEEVKSLNLVHNAEISYKVPQEYWEKTGYISHSDESGRYCVQKTGANSLFIHDSRNFQEGLPQLDTIVQVTYRDGKGKSIPIEQIPKRDKHKEARENTAKYTEQATTEIYTEDIDKTVQTNQGEKPKQPPVEYTEPLESETTLNDIPLSPELTGNKPEPATETDITTPDIKDSPQPTTQLQEQSPVTTEGIEDSQPAQPVQATLPSPAIPPPSGQTKVQPIPAAEEKREEPQSQQQNVGIFKRMWEKAKTVIAGTGKDASPPIQQQEKSQAVQEEETKESKDNPATHKGKKKSKITKSEQQKSKEKQTEEFLKKVKEKHPGKDAYVTITNETLTGPLIDFMEPGLIQDTKNFSKVIWLPDLKNPETSKVHISDKGEFEGITIKEQNKELTIKKGENVTVSVDNKGKAKITPARTRENEKSNHRSLDMGR